jgi:hypothetical protein
MAIPKKPSQYGGIPVHDVNSAQEALLQIMDSPKKEQSAEVEETIETTEEVSEQGMEPESVETETEETLETGDLDVEDLVDDNQEEEGETPDTYTIRVDGKDVEVTLDELKNGYSRQADYTRKSQVLAEQRQRADHELATTQQERQRYLSQLKQIDSQANAEIERYKNLDWERLKEEDRDNYYEKRDAYRELKDNQTKLREEQRNLMAKEQVLQKQQYSEALSQQQEILKANLPEWFDPKNGRKLKDQVFNYAMSPEVGFNKEEVSSLIDARSVQVLHKAMLYDKLKNAKIAKKRTKVVPKVTKPGTGTTKADVSSEKHAKLRARAKNTGKVDDAAKLLESLL